tara:strand:+ start:324 stop:746 length:423 start_codon:yes stop_codon:yes gene_type:complete
MADEPLLSTRFKLNGPVFSGKVSDDMQRAVNTGLLDLATLEGSNKVKEQLTPGHGRLTGNLRNHIGANLIKDNEAQIDAGEFRYGANLIYSAWVEGISTKNDTSSFKGYQMFENAYNDIDNNPKLYEDYIGNALVEVLEK